MPRVESGGFLRAGAVRGEGIGTQGSGRGGKGRGREKGGFWGRGVGFIRKELDPAARRATVDGHVRGRNGPDAAKIRHAMKVVDFGARF